MLKRRKRTLIAVICVLLAAAAAAAVWVVAVRGKKLSVAADSSRYGTAQVHIERTATRLENALDPEDDEDSSETEYTDTVADMEKDGDRIHINGISGEYYFYERDGEEYVAYTERKEDDASVSVWREVLYDEANIKPDFDFSVLDSIDTDDFTGKNGCYSPDEEKLADIFMLLLNLNENYSDRYDVKDLKIYISGGRIEKIETSYIFSSLYSINQTYSFSYEDIEVELPEIGSEVENEA